MTFGSALCGGAGWVVCGFKALKRKQIVIEKLNINFLHFENGSVTIHSRDYFWNQVFL